MRASCFTGNSLSNTGPNRSYIASTGRRREPLGQNVSSGIDITIVCHAAFGTSPLTNIQHERIEHVFTRAASFTGGIPLIDLDERAPIPLALVLQLSHQLGPTNITNRFCQFVILDHVLDSQTLHADHLVLVDDACRELVLVVSPSVLNASVNTGYLVTGLIPVLRAFLLPGMPTLCFCQLLFVLGKEFGVADCFTSGEDDNRFEAKIKPYLLVNQGPRLDVLLNQNGHEVPICTVFRDCYRCGFAILRKSTGPYDIERSVHLSKCEGSSIPFESRRSIGCRLGIVSFLEGGILGTSLKEVLECAVQMPQRLLNGHARNIREPGILRLEVWQHGRKRIVV